MRVTSEPAGLVDGVAVRQAILRNEWGLEAAILSFGATLRWLRLPDRGGRPVDLVLGYDRPQDYARRPEAVGATVGRFANRSAPGRFTLDGRV